MMEKILKVALIGCGGVANAAHIPAWAAMPRVQVVAVCDLIAERAAAAAERLGVAPSGIYTDYKQVLALPEVDAVDICTPNYMHSVIAVDALNAGKHVFCEKPDAVSVAEATRMKQAAEQSGKVLMVMRNNRYHNASAYLKQYIKDGRMGEVYAARCGWIRRRGIPGKGGWFTTKALSGGGPLIDLGVHMIDLTLWLMGNPRPVAVSGCTYTKFAQSGPQESIHSSFGDAKADGVFDVEDLAMGFIRLDNGACIQIEFSWASNIGKERVFVELRGTKAGSCWDADEGTLNIFSEEYGRLQNSTPITGIQGLENHATNLRHFTEVLLDGVEPMFVPQQGVDMIAILEAMYRSAELGREVRLEELQ